MRVHPIVIVCGLLELGCAGDDGDVTMDASTADPGEMPLEIRFLGMWGSEPVACDRVFPGAGVGGHPVQLADARIYLSNLHIVRQSGEAIPIALTDDDAWQNATTVLLDYENATGRCSAANTTATNDRVLGTVPSGDYGRLRFDVGVAPSENHIDSTLADPPLNESSMFWSWRDGFMFMRADLSVEVDGAANAWSFHLGSTGAPCSDEGGPAHLPPATTCGRPSRPSIDLPFDPTNDVIHVDLSALFRDVDLGAPPDPQTGNPGGCHSFDFEATDDACRSPFSALGLDVASGDCASGCDGQTVFRRSQG